MASRPSNNPYGDAVMVDRLIGTAYDVVRTVSENILYVKHVSLNLPHVLTANDNIAVIAQVSQAINDVIAVADKLVEIDSVEAKLTEIVGVYGQLAKVVTVANNIQDVELVSQNMTQLLQVIETLDEIEDIYNALPELEAIAAQKDDILSAALRTENAATNATAASFTASDAALRAENAKAAAEAIQQNLLTSLSATATTLTPAQPATASYNAANKRITFGIPKGDTGNTGPANTLTVGNVIAGSVPAVAVRGSSPNQILDFTLVPGEKGWSPALAAITDGQRKVLRLVDWVGGVGTKPAVGQYLGSTGLVPNIADAVDIRGASGSGSGDMLSDVFDPSHINGDVFLMSNMKETTNSKVMTADERTKLANLAAVASSGDYADLQNKPNIPQGTVTSVGIVPPENMEVTPPITSSGNLTLSFSGDFGLLENAERARLLTMASEATKNATDAFLLDRANHTGTQPMSSVEGLTEFVDDAVSNAESTENKGVPNGYASLDNAGKVPLSQMNDSILGAMNYQGNWNAATNSPAIPAASAGNKGYYRIVSTAGNTIIDGTGGWAIGDWIVSNGTTWAKIANTQNVVSVAGKQGAVVLAKADVGLGNVDNTSDANKPVSTAQANAISAKANKAGDIITGLWDMFRNASSGGTLARLRNAVYGLHMYLDAGQFYLLTTNINDPTGSYNSNRPFTIRLSDGLTQSQYFHVQTQLTTNATPSFRYGVHVTRDGAPTAEGVSVSSVSWGYFGVYSSGTVAMQRNSNQDGIETSSVRLANDGRTGLQHNHDGVTATVLTTDNFDLMVYTGSDANNTDFPIGTVLPVAGDNARSLARNASRVIRLSGTGAYMDGGSGATVSGTWRKRGNVAESMTLFEKCTL